ncbi:hypothetical protein WA1_29205 [Scytonema hofmannii PCC 7110]|uniref:Uncharacterized protein n=1 Tax=Scytonema hofmannii PCC 7110 TaxID=128403 RepID=A0A139X5Q4_9CYAN|nr:hypothetical protein WA1_29205 [Scytonema hofmannii PCC 7110]
MVSYRVGRDFILLFASLTSLEDINKGEWGMGNSGPPLGIRGNGELGAPSGDKGQWGTRGPLWG